YVENDVLEVDEHPLAIALTLFAEGAETGFLGFFNHAVRNGLDVTIGVTGGNDHGVGYVRQPPYIQHLHIDCFHVVQRCGYDFLQWGGALRLRGAARSCTSDHVFKWVLLVSSSSPIKA